MGRVSEHGGVHVLDPVVGEIQVADGGAGLRQGGRGHRYELVERLEREGGMVKSGSVKNKAKILHRYERVERLEREK